MPRKVDQLNLSDDCLPGRGGYRPGAGRPPGPPKKRKWITETDYQNLDYYRQLSSLVDEWRILSDAASSTSPRWEKFREFLDALDASESMTQ